MNDVKAINLFRIKSDESIPKIELSGEYLYQSNFFPNQLLQAEIYEGKIIITPVPGETTASKILL